MRALTLATIASFLVGCASNESGDLGVKRRTPDPTPDADTNDPFRGVPEVVVEEQIPQYDYPTNLYETPSREARTRTGRWTAMWEGSSFADADTGETFCTVGVDDALYELVEIGDSFYDWNACLDTTIVAAVADYPSPFFPCFGTWLIVREVVSASPCSCAARDGLLCHEWLP